MTRLGPSIEPITSPTPGGCATSYATDVGLKFCVKSPFICQYSLVSLFSGTVLLWTWLYIVIVALLLIKKLYYWKRYLQFTIHPDQATLLNRKRCFLILGLLSFIFYVFSRLTTENTLIKIKKFSLRILHNISFHLAYQIFRLW